MSGEQSAGTAPPLTPPMGEVPTPVLPFLQLLEQKPKATH